MSNNIEDEQESALELLKEAVAEIAIVEGANIRREVSEQFLLDLTNVIHKYIGKMAEDLEDFADHDDRSIISMEDVKLCGRRNMSLYKMISDMADEINPSRELDELSRTRR